MVGKMQESKKHEKRELNDNSCNGESKFMHLNEVNLDVIWYKISERSSFCSKCCCIVTKPMSSGSRSPIRQLFISRFLAPSFCLYITSVGFTSNTRSFKTPSRAVCGILVERILWTLPSHPRILTAVEFEKRRAGPTHNIEWKCDQVKKKQSNEQWKTQTMN